VSRAVALAALIALATLLAACSTTPKPEEGEPAAKATTPASRYPISRDGAPLVAISPDDVSDAVPRPDPLLAVGNKSPYTVNGETYSILKDYRGYREQGTASWYGAKFDGHETSNGEIYDLYQASAAHKTLPIPCFAKVTNLDNGKSMIVRVNDRGPFHSERIIDLSYAAAVKLGYMSAGTARVEVEVVNVIGVDDLRDTTAGNYRFLQLGAFGSEETAQRLYEQVQAMLNQTVIISKVQSGEDLLYRVRVGPLAGHQEMLAVQRSLEESGFPGGLPLP